MFNILYAKSVLKDLNKIAAYNLKKIKDGIADSRGFPDIPQIKHLKNHPIAEYRLRIGNYRVLPNVNWKKKEIYILKIGHRRNIY